MSFIWKMKCLPLKVLSSVEILLHNDFESIKMIPDEVRLSYLITGKSLKLTSNLMIQSSLFLTSMLFFLKFTLFSQKYKKLIQYHNLEQHIIMGPCKSLLIFSTSFLITDSITTNPKCTILFSSM